jgi:nucleotide-binding universal stress UspA family protein
MFKPIKSIMFATDLSETCRQAFEMAAAMATKHQATLVLMHVLEQMPDNVESRLKGLLGQSHYDELINKHSANAREALIGKKSSNTLIQEALAQFCTNAGIDDDSCDYQSREILVMEGNVVEEILNQAKKFQCDLIVMGSREGFLSDNKIGHTIKSVMRSSNIPVMMVPPASE